jgi:hypothetical protein
MQPAAGMDFVIVKSAVRVVQCVPRFEAFPFGKLLMWRFHAWGQMQRSFDCGEIIFWEKKCLITPHIIFIPK